MGDQAQKLFREATESYMAGDANRAAALGDMDGYLDDLQRQFVALIFDVYSGDKIELQVAVQLAMVARFYERIGDHAVNIGERVRYLVTGWLPEHEGAARFNTRAAASDLE
jgi:phosphate transport system protein